MRTEEFSPSHVDQSAVPADAEDGGPRPLPARPALLLDVERYQAMLDSPELTEEESTAFVEALWGIVVGFVDLGFQIHPLQQVPPCGQVAPTAEDLAKVFADVVSSPPTKPKQRRIAGSSRAEGKPGKEDS